MINEILKLVKSFLKGFFTKIGLNNNPSESEPKNYSYAYDRFREEELKSSYDYFKKYFYNAIFLKQNDLRKYAIQKALEIDKDEENLFLEFGVYKGESTNFFSKHLMKKLYAFESFKGLDEDWLGSHHAAGDFGDIEIPKLNKNVDLIIGYVQDTLPKFILDNKNSKISFVHMDVDVYLTTKFILKEIKPYLNDKAIICFDEFYNYQGWKLGEFKAFTELFSEDEYSYKCFAVEGERVVIQYNKKI